MHRYVHEVKVGVTSLNRERGGIACGHPSFLSVVGVLRLILLSNKYQPA